MVNKSSPSSFSPERPLRPSLAAEMPNQEALPPWFRVPLAQGKNYEHLKSLIKDRKLHTVCQEARCPNIGECWSAGTATLLLGSDTCTRACRFCAIKTARRPPPLDPEEPLRVAQSLVELGLTYVVLTSVDRDDLADGGASHFSRTIQAIKRLNPSLKVEALVPDFRGEQAAIDCVLDSKLDVYAHNLETVRRLHGRVRDPRAGYDQSLQTLAYARQEANRRGECLLTKSSLMLGFGETAQEVEQALQDLRAQGVDIVTLGQYLRPSPQHLPVEKFYSPEEFRIWSEKARTLGFLGVSSGPLVRSSYRAGEQWVEDHFNSLETPPLSPPFKGE